MDPGNWARISRVEHVFGLPVIVGDPDGNLIAILMQALSAKLGIATARRCRRFVVELPAMGIFCFMGHRRAAAMPTDLAEFLGGASF